MSQSTLAADRVASPRRIAALALPALVVLAAEPLYVLVDTAVVGHLGRVPLAAVAVGGTVMTLTAWLGTVVAYAGGGEVALAAAEWLRIAAFGAPGLLLAAAGNGWLRGVQDTRRPLLFVVGPNLLSAVLCPVLVYPVGMGLIGSAVANVIAQTLSGALFAAALVAERVALRPRPRVIGQQLVLSRDLLIRGVAFQASFLSATAVAARFGAATVGAHQIAVQLWFFAALVLDALAIAAQALVGAALGGGDDAGAAGWARSAVRRSPCSPRLVPPWCPPGSPPIARSTSRRWWRGPGSPRCCHWPGWCSPSTVC